MSENEPLVCSPRRLLNIHRIVQCFVVVGLIWKIQFFRWTDDVYLTFPLSDPFFPDWLESQRTLRIAYLAAVASGLLAILLNRRFLLVLVTIIEWAALSVLMIHQGSYNDVTFTTSWWTVLWCLFVSSQLQASNPLLTSQRAARLACVILSLIMLGAAVGKWTTEYWSGVVLYEIYFRERDFWFFNWLRDCYSEDQLQVLSLVHSRIVIIVETIAGLTLWCLPSRIAGWCGMLLMLFIPLSNNYMLFSVTLSLLGLGWAAVMLSKGSPSPCCEQV